MKNEMQWVRILVVAAVAVAVCGPLMVNANLASDMQRRQRPEIETLWEDAMLPCTCAHQVLNCSGRGPTPIEQESLCSGNFTVVDISYNLLKMFPYGLTGATVVNASNNRLATLPEVEKLNPRITVLDVSDNAIINVTESYQSLGSLRELRISRTIGISSLSFLPRPCALRVLIARSLQLRTLDENVRECRQLEVLDISNNLFTSLASGSFSTLTHLRELDISYNSIESLSPQLFVTLAELRILKLSAVGLKTLPSHIFDSLSNLEYLRLNRNSLQSLPSRIFSGLTRLYILDLSTNDFQTLPIEAFQDLRKLQELDMEHNKLTQIPNNSFVSLPNIKEILLRSNEIVSVDSNIFSNGGHVETLTLDLNPLTTLPVGLLTQLPNLEIIFVSCMNDSEVLTEMSHVTTIAINECGVTHWRSRQYSALSSAVRLIINDHKIVSIANDTLDGLPALKLLDISHNEITALPEPFFSYTRNLTSLVIFKNYLTTFPENIFSGLVHLKDLSLDENHLVNLPENLFQGMSSLERINLNSNQLASIPNELFSNLPSLKQVSLDHNRLTTLPLFQSSWPPLHKFSLSANKLREIPAAALRSWMSADVEPRYIMIVEDIGHGVDPATLGWLLHEPGVQLGCNTEFTCRCGCFRRGANVVVVCTNASCPTGQGAVSRGWVDTLRASSASGGVNETGTQSRR